MKKINLLSLGVLTFSSVVLGATSVSASKEQPVANTDATVQFKVDNEKEPPVDPGEGGNNSGGTVNPEKPGTDGEVGDGDPSFNITFVSNFRFNEKDKFENGAWTWKPIKLNNNGMSLYAYGTDLTLNRVNADGKWINAAGEEVETAPEAQKLVYNDIPNVVQVTDNRGNKKAGWKLDVMRTEFTAGTGEDADVLTGAQLSLNDPSIKGPLNVAEPVYFDQTLLIPTDGSATVASAEAGTGTGSWALAFGKYAEELTTVAGTETEEEPVTYKKLALENGTPKSGVKLVVPAEAQAQANVVYKAALTWTLSTVPSE